MITNIKIAFKLLVLIGIIWIYINLSCNQYLSSLKQSASEDVYPDILFEDINDAM